MAVILFVLFLAGLHTLLASEQCVAGGPHCKTALANESDVDDLAPAVLLLQSGLRREEVGDAGRHRRRRRRRRYNRQFGSNCAVTVLGKHSYFGGGLLPEVVDACTDVTESVNSAHVLVDEGCRVVMHRERGCRGEERELLSAVNRGKPRVLVLSHLSDIGWGGGRLSALSCTCGDGDRASAEPNDHEDDDDDDDEEDREEPVDEHEEDKAEEAQGHGEDQGAEDEDGPAADEEVQGVEGDSAPADEAGREDFAEEHAGDEADGGDESSPGEVPGEVPEGPETRTGLVRLEEGSARGRRRRFHRSWSLHCTWNFYRNVNFHGTSWPWVAGRDLCSNSPHSVRSALNLPGRRQSSGYGFVAPGCRLELFDEKDCRGEALAFVRRGRLAARFHSHFGELRDRRGDGWNDRVLSVMCRCS